jgi:putative Holliday junction resolvase
MTAPQNRVKPSRIVSIDYGSARLGMAISDETRTIALSLATLIGGGSSEKLAHQVILTLNQLQERYQCDLSEIVIGLPLLLNGKAGLLADEVRHFITILSTLTSIAIYTWDERLTSVQADRALRESQLTRKKRAKLVDSISAVIILQSYLEYKRVQNERI